MNGRNGRVFIFLAFQTNFASREFSQLSLAYDMEMNEWMREICDFN